jgi:hypothetical protein
MTRVIAPRAHRNAPGMDARGPRTSRRSTRTIPMPVHLIGPEDQNENFSPSSPIRGGVCVDKIFPKVELVNVVFGLPSTV